MAVPVGVPQTFDEHIKLQFDLLALAFQADITRVATVLYARDLTGRVYPESGTNISFHGGSHHAEDPGQIKRFAQLNRYHVQMLAYFLEKLRATPDGEGNVLDHAVVAHFTARIVSLEPRTHGVRLVLDEVRSGTLDPAPRRIRVAFRAHDSFHPGQWLSLTARLDTPPPSPLVQ